MKALELYIHIPFCVRKCKYCDFLSGPATRAEQEIYVESLCREICSYTDLAKAYRVVSIFLGGGTPSRWKQNRRRAYLQQLTEHLQSQKAQRLQLN